MGGSVRPKNLKKCMKLNWNFQRGVGGGSLKKSLPWEGYGYFLELQLEQFQSSEKHFYARKNSATLVNF